MSSIITFKPGHLDFLEMKDCYNDVPGIIERTNMAYYNKNSYIYTMVNGSRVIAVVGGTIIWNGVMEVWAVTSKLVKKHMFSFIRLMRRLINLMWETFKLHRMYVMALKDDDSCFLWPRSLGFEYEGKLNKHYSDGSDLYIFGRVK